LPPLGELRKLSFQVAIAVAKEAESEGLTLPVAEGDLVAAVKSKMWEPLYATYQRLRSRRERPRLCGRKAACDVRAGGLIFIPRRSALRRRLQFFGAA
jgi:hypothetical protein